MFVEACGIAARTLGQSAGRDPAAVIRRVRYAMTPLTKVIRVREDGRTKAVRVTRTGVGPLLTDAGRFWQLEFQLDDAWEAYEVLLHAPFDTDTMMPVWSSSEVLVRPDSGCTTGQRFGDLTCDCGGQLRLAMGRIAAVGQGLIIHIPNQDGRGKGTSFKLGTLWLQDDLGVTTIDAASMLAHDGLIDVRTYAGAIAILLFLGLSTASELALASNNPQKANVFLENFPFTRREVLAVPPTPHTERHLRAKESRLGHIGLVSLPARSTP